MTKQNVLQGQSNSSQIEGIVFDIQHFTIHDGPGIRTEIFMKGCALNCKWCSNPESIKLAQEVGVYASKCIGIDKCNYCVEVCPVADMGVFKKQDNIIVGIDRNICTNCMKCVDACPAEALIEWGKRMSVSDVMHEIMADIDFYKKSGGGVTISGGDPLVQWQFTSEILKECHKQNIHTCLETELHSKTNILLKLFPFIDLMITDIKHMDSKKHKEYTGVDNHLILENIILIAEKKMPLIIRIPVVPGYNDSEENIKATAEFIIEKLHNNILQIQLLPYRPLGVDKYDSLGKKYPMADFKLLDLNVRDNKIEKLADIMKSYGINVVTSLD